METLLKWLNKPKADDKSLLARFFHADRALAAVASELDSFDGRAEPDRCSRLVSRLRQGQDKVLAITNLIIEELLGDERDQRAFRAKFPEEVLQENLAGQLWFGAECLAAGSSIMNREQESKEMRPLAEAVTRSLNNVRFLLRGQCLRNNVPNSERLNLDKNDAATEQLYESLKRFDRLFAEFEWRYVSAMVQVKSKEEYETQELICVLCSETLQRALKLGLLEQDKVDAFDPALMFSIPRLAIVSGLIIYPDGPLNMDVPAEQLSELFRPFRSILLKVRDYLRNLNETELYCLERLLCTNEEISLKDTLDSKDSYTSLTSDNNMKSSKYNENTSQENDKKINSLKTTTTTSILQQNTTVTTSSSSCKTFRSKSARRADSPSPVPSTTSSSSSSDECSSYNTPVSSTPSSPRSSRSLLSTTSAGDETNGTTSPDSWMQEYPSEHTAEEKSDNEIFLPNCEEDGHYADDDDSDIDCSEDNENMKNDLESNIEEDKNMYSVDNVAEQIGLEMASVDCITGYLISNTTLGNLLQPQEVPLTDNFIVSDTDLPINEDCNDNLVEEQPSTSAKALTQTSRNQQHNDLKETQDNNNNPATTSLSNLQDPNILFERTIANSFIETAKAEENSKNNPSSETTTSATTTCARRRAYSSDQHSISLSQPTKQVVTTDHSRSHRHQHRHHHHHHHYNHHNNSTASNNRSSIFQHNQSHHRHRVHHAHSHSHRRPHRHGGDKHTTVISCAKCSGGKGETKEDSLEDGNKSKSFGVLDIETPSSSSSLLEDNKSIAKTRSTGRTKFKNTENLLHRLFVCIAGVADQLQTNFAFDLRQILRSVFLMNMSEIQEELEIPEKSKDNELFEFRASENDVIQESAGSSQSIYSAEEVNPEGDNQSSSSSNTSSTSNDVNISNRHSTGNTINTTQLTNNESVDSTPTVNYRQQIERSRSLDNQDCPAIVEAQTQQQAIRQQPELRRQHHVFRNRYNSTGSNSPSVSSSENSSPVCERSANATNRTVSEMDVNSMQQQLTSASSIHLSPPAWIPDQKAPRCMSCNTPFTAFRRRHHCRNCGGVFCGVCSSNSTPLPKYGLTKAVRVCRSCYTHELSANSHQNHHHHNHHSQLVSQTTTNSNNNEPRLRRPVTTTGTID